MIFKQIKVGPMENFSYMFADEITREGAVTDPGFDYKKLVKIAKDENINLTAIFLTHNHYDHTQETKALKSHTGAKVYAHPEAERLLRGNVSVDALINHGDKVMLGSVAVECIHTPGHSPGSVCLLLNDKYLLTGDTLFVGNCGRDDLPESSPNELIKSLKLLYSLPDHLLVCPGHDYGETPTSLLGEEKQTNPCMLTAIKLP
ncbi:MAG: MBL fold metallo-hydrolase [Candidatus Riflebacteria bacterium]|nr:MBL fold metallo-hydrolase [Candidatus Riflebacteria bacterium]